LASEVQRPRWYRANIASPEFNAWPPAKAAAFRNEILKSRAGTDKQIFKARTSRVLQTVPLLDWH
jgi:hypothetical protein